MENLKAWVEDEIEKIKKDERYHYPPANVAVNAPLALLQVDFEARIRALREFRERLHLLEVQV